MRLIITLNHLPDAEILSGYLKSKGIDNQLDVIKNSNWEDTNYGDVTCNIWVYDENLLPQSLEIANEFNANPANPKFHIQSSPAAQSNETSERQPKSKIRNIGIQSPMKEPLGRITLFLLLACIFVFFFTSTESLTTENDADPAASQYLFFSPMKRTLLFDYPLAFENLDKLVQTFGVETIQKNENLPNYAQILIKDINQTPYWKGMYDKVVTHLQDPSLPWNFSAPLFEKIRQGEVWRFITPAFMHADIFHLLFNMIWLVVLGKQLEQRMGSARYILFVAIAAIVTNTAQYLAGGFSFLGISGVLCAMLAFVWMRQRQAAWEGYFLQPSTMGFMMAFLGLMLLFQTISFYAEVAFNTSVAPPIANTAHMSGLAVGLLLGRMDFFAWKN